MPWYMVPLRRASNPAPPGNDVQVVASRLQRGGLLTAGWLLLIGLLAAVNAGEAVSAGSLVAADPGRVGLRFNLYVAGAATAVSIVVGILSPRWWHRAMLALAIIPVFVLGFTSHTLTAVLAVLALLLPAVWCGRQIASALLGWLEPLEAWTIGSGIGIALIAFWGLALGLVGLLRPQAIWLACLLLTSLLVVGAGRQARKDFASFVAWVRCPVRRRPLYFLLAGMALGQLWLNTAGALAPETGADAIVQRLATAASFAQMRRLAVTYPELAAARSPAAGEVIYAVTLAAGPDQTAKLLNFITGLFCVAAAFAIGRHLLNAEAGGIAAFAFYTMPIVAWLSQTAYLDLFTTFLALVATLVLLRCQKPGGRARAAAVAGAFLGLGVAIKLHFGYVAVGVAVMLGLIALGSGRWHEGARLLAILVVASVLAAAPWLVRSYVLTGQVPGMALSRALLTQTPIADLDKFGYGRSPDDLLRLPFDLTFRNQQFGSHTKAGLGYLLLALVPLLAVSRPGRLTWATLAGACMALLLWFATAQYQRYGLPIFGMFCTVGGVAYVAAEAKLKSARLRTVLHGSLLLLALAGVSVQLKEPLLSRDYVLGKEDPTTYLAKYVRGYATLQLLNAEPGATRALTSTVFAQLYSSVRLSPIDRTGRAVASADKEDLVLARLDAEGYSHILIDREALPPNWYELLALNEEFLRRNTALVGGSGNVYLYRILPPDQRGGKQPWTLGEELLLNGGFEIPRGDAPLGWTPFNQPVYDTSGTQSYHGRAAVRATPESGFVASVSVVPNVQYLLSHATRGVADEGFARLWINWLDAEGHFLQSAQEVVPASPRGYRYHSMLATAPPNAETALIYIQTYRGEIWFDDISFRSLPPGPRLAAPENLLADPGFEGLFRGTATVWKQYGRQDEAGVRLNPFQIGAAVYAWPDSGFWQAVPVQAGRFYRLSYTAWSPDPHALARLQINWLRDDGSTLFGTVKVIGVAQIPVPFSQWMQAPPGAAYAQVYVSVQEGGPVWFDNYALQPENRLRR